MLHLSELDKDQENCDVTPKFAKISEYHKMERAAAEPVVNGEKSLEPVQHRYSQTMSDFSKVRKQICDKEVSASELVNSSVVVSIHSSASDSDLLCTRVVHCSSSCPSVSHVSATTSPLSSTSSLLCPETELCDSSSTSPVLHAGSVPASDSLSQTVFTSGALASFNQQIDSEESFDPTVMKQDGLQSPYSSTSSSSACYQLTSIAQQDFNPDSSCCGSLYVSTDLGSLCSTFSTVSEIGTPPPAVASVPLTTSVSVPHSQTSCFLPCSSQVDLNPQIPSSFNFSSTSFLPNRQTFNFSTSPGGCMSEAQLHEHDRSIDSMMQQVFGEGVEDPNVTGIDISLPESDSCMFTDPILSLSHPGGNFAQNSILSEQGTSASAQLSPTFVSRLLFESQTIYSCPSSNSGPEVNNIFQQFI